MQKLLNTYFFVPCSYLWQRIFLTTKAGLLATVMLLIMGLAQPAAATNFYKDYVVLNNRYFYTNNSSYGLPFQDSNLGSFDRGTGQLLIGGEANTTSTNGDNVYTPQMYYKVYLQGTPQATVYQLPFTPLTLDFQSSGNDGDPNSKKWSNTTNNSNLLAATSGPGRYVLEVYFSAFVTYNNSGGSGNFNIFDSRNGTINYTATFDVTGSVPMTWNGTQSEDWFDDRNWTPNGQPTSTTDVLIPYSANAKYYPTINRSVAYVRTLSIQGNNSAIGAHNYMQGGELQVYGDFRDPNGGFNQTGGVFTLAGTTQTFDGGSFFNVNIQGGGVKTLTNSIDIFTSLAFVNGGGVISTSTYNSATFKVDLGANAQVTGESESSYVLGYLRARTLNIAAGATYPFGNIGLDLTPTGGNTGGTLVTRLTGSSNAGVGSKGASITRSFAVLPDNPNNLNYTLTFHYLNTELNGNTAANLGLFRSVNGTATFESLGKTSAGDNTVTRTAIQGTLATGFTLAEVTPLPVTLVSFTAAATAQGGALLRWKTATETNNKGFGIERQLTSGGTWQSVGYLASGNSANGNTYEYNDKSLITAAATPQAYYRLRQEDVDGKISYSPVAVVSRSAVVTSTSLLLSPVPVTGAAISLAFAEAGQAGSEITITNTQGQRLFNYTTQASDNEALSLPVAKLAAGVYIVSVRVPGQALRYARFVKL